MTSENLSSSSRLTWVEDLVQYFRELGGEAHYSDLYKYIEANPRRTLGKEWQAVVLRTIEEHSSDTTIWPKRRLPSPSVLKPLAQLNAGKRYEQQVKPFNFIISCHVRPLGHPIGIDPERFHLIAPYETDPRRWEKTQWIDEYSGKRYRITASGPHGSRTVARVKSYGDVLREYEFHPEAKCADASGAPCSKQTAGLLSRRRVAIDQIT